MHKPTDAEKQAYYKAIRERYLFVECDNCGEATPCEPGPSATLPLTDEDHEISIPSDRYVQVENGFCLDLSGHYAGFTDDMFGEELSRVVLCHDCSLAVARALPGIFKKGSGHHSMTTQAEILHHGSCCEFAWRISDDKSCTLIGDGDGGWIVAPTAT